MSNQEVDLSHVDRRWTVKELMGSEGPHRFDALADKIFSILWEELNFFYPCIAMHDDRINALKVMKHASHPKLDSLLKSTTGKAISDFEFNLACDENLLVASYKKQEIFTRQSVADLAKPYLVNPLTIKGIDRVVRLKMFAVVPMTVGSQSIGVLCFGSRTSSSLTKMEEFFLRLLSEQVGLYLHQSWIIKLLQGETTDLRKKNHDLLEIVKMKRDFLTSLSDLIKETPPGLLTRDNGAERIQDHLKYLHSLLLISDSTDKNLLPPNEQK